MTYCYTTGAIITTSSNRARIFFLVFMNLPPRTIQVAPMMDYTDRHCRYFMRLLTKNAWLFSEMITAQAILRGDPTKLLAFHPDEHPVVLQLGGSNPEDLSEATKIVAKFGYDEVNLNVGCPSSRVKSGRFGACLMAEPQLVADCLQAMQEASSLPVSVKIRLGIDDLDSYAFLQHFVSTVARAGCKNFIVHARKAWLKGLSPKQNREIPPLQYDRVYQLKQDFPDLMISLNGGIQSLEAAQAHLKKVDSVMIGRAAYYNPYLLAQVDQQFYQCSQVPPSRENILAWLVPYMEQECAQGTLPHHITRHILGLFQGIPGARNWRRQLTGPFARKGDQEKVIFFEKLMIE
jgi:tRNA-dihydrouridine synthase A